MEVPHADLTKVTRVVLVHVRSVVMLATSQTSTTGVLAVLANATVTGGDVAAAAKRRTCVSTAPVTSNPICLLEDGTRLASRGSDIRAPFEP